MQIFEHFLSPKINPSIINVCRNLLENVGKMMEIIENCGKMLEKCWKLSENVQQQERKVE